MADDRRLELRVSGEWLERLDGVRGGVPRGTFVKLTMEKALGASVGNPEAGVVRVDPSAHVPVPTPAPSRPSVAEVPGRPARREGESRVDWNIRLKEWQQLNS